MSSGLLEKMSVDSTYNEYSVWPDTYKAVKAHTPIIENFTSWDSYLFQDALSRFSKKFGINYPLMVSQDYDETDRLLIILEIDECIKTNKVRLPDFDLKPGVIY